MNSKTIIICLCFFLVVLKANSFVPSRSESGSNLSWNSSDRNISIVINTTNDDGMTEDIVESVIESSIDEWNSGDSDIEITFQRDDAFSNPDDEDDGINGIYFTRDESFGGPATLAITSVLYALTSGRILEADIKINDNKEFSTSVDAVGVTFLGDVITHELGHLLGLSHGQVHGASMTFTTFIGQYSLHSDELEAVNAIYKLSSGGPIRGEIKGKVAGSSSAIGVFGAYIQAVSTSSGKVVAAAATEPDGSFSLSSLPVDDIYYLYVSPLKIKDSLPRYYSTLRTDFCPAGRSWQGSYFQKCGTSENGNPQGFFVNSGVPVDVGIISIQCGFLIPSSNNLEGVGAVTGSFTDGEIASNHEDSILNDSSQRKNRTYTVDLSSYTPRLGETDLYLDIKLVAQAMYSPLRMNVIVSRTGETEQMFPSAWNSIRRISEVAFDGNNYSTLYDFDHSGANTIHFPLDETTTANNIFTIELVPQPLPSATIHPVHQMFPSKDQLASTLSHYLMILTLSNKSGTTYTTVVERDGSPYADNRACLKASNAYPVQAQVSSTPQAEESARSSTVKSPTLCGSVDIDGSGPSSGGGNFALILTTSLLMLIASRGRKKQNFSP